MNKSIKILSPCGILGYGFPEQSFLKGMEDKPNAIVVDAGSTDAGPHKMGAGVPIVSRMACKKDLLLLVTASTKNRIPLIVSSAGGSGAKKHTEWTLDILYEIIKEQNISAKVAIIWADIPNEAVKRAIDNNETESMSSNIPPLTHDIVDSTNGIVAQMGVEPIIEALENEADIIICGRAYDPAPFAAVGIFSGFDEALSYHLGKILECGALCAEPGSAKDCMIGVLYEDCFEVYPTNYIRKCTPVSVAAHTFYEKDHPYILHAPGIELNLHNCTFDDVGNGRVRVSGSKLSHTPIYKIKLEGARRVAYRTFVIAGVRDPLLIEKIEQVEEEVKQSVAQYYSEIPAESYQINFINYGKNGVMGNLEPNNTTSHEIGVMFEVIAETQAQASAICSSLRSTFLHYGYDGRKSTAGNLAFPFAPSDVEFGAVYEFSVYHLMNVKDGKEMFPIEYREVQYGEVS